MIDESCATPNQHVAPLKLSHSSVMAGDCASLS